ncbi:Vacuolar protein sorting-associated protein 52 [Lecanora helva]
MWLDRLSAHSTRSVSPQSHKRSESPAIRRPSHLGPGGAFRPGLSPRSSSLNVAKFNDSSTSLISPRLPNGSSLKQEVPLPEEHIDSLKLLGDIIGIPVNDEYLSASRDAVQEKPAILEDVDFNGLDLHEFLEAENVTRLEEEDGKTPLAKEYEEEKDKFEDLHKSILACDDVLSSVETSLFNFQKDLGAVSAEIETLQSRSTTLNTKLENRKAVEKLLGPAVEEVSISPAIITKLCDGPIDQAWVKALEVLEKRLNNVESKLSEPDKILAASDLKPLLEDLANLANERIRDFFVSQIKALRSPNINAQIIQQGSFLAYKEIYGFLARRHAALAEEIGQAYINTMRWYYSSHFTRYKLALERIPLYSVDKHDAIGDQINQKGGPRTSQVAHDALALGRRIDILKTASSSALPSHIAEETKTRTNSEAPFHAFNIALVDNASFEYSFLTTFFSNVSFQTLSQYFNSIFSSTFSLGHSFTKQLIEDSYDCLGILLSVRLNQHLAFKLQRRKCPAMDSYINGTNMLLWPRFQLAMDMHVESVRRSTTALSGGARATLSLTGSGADNKGSTAPHVLTQRFGQFLQAILALSNSDTSLSITGEGTSSDSEPVIRSLQRLRGEVEGFLTKAAKSLPQGKRERYLGNNYSLVLTIIGDTGGGLAKDMRERFEQLREDVGG